jgi:hypothetical protein
MAGKQTKAIPEIKDSLSMSEPVYALTPELEEAIKAAHDALARRALLDDAVNESPAQIAEAELEAERLRGEVGAAEAELALSSGAEAKRLEQHIDGISAALSSKEVAIRRMHARVAALEAKALELDAAIEDAGQTLNREASMFGAGLKAQISAELRESVKPVLAVLSKAHSVGLGLFNDFFFAAYLPDPEFFIGPNFAERRGVGVNLLDVRGADGQNPVATALAPVKAALAAIRAHRPYVPLAKRPKPYTGRRGAWDGPGGRTGERIERSEQVEAQPDGAGDSKADKSAGSNARYGFPAEMNVTASIDAAARSAGL